MFNKNHLNNMQWFEGVVENRMDPLKLGRVGVRIFGLHTDDLTQIPEEDLLWASCLLPTTSATMNGIGETPALVEGTHVVGFFRDGDDSHQAIIMGSVPGIPTKSRNINKGFYDHRTDLAASSVPGKPTYTTGNNFTDATREAYPKQSYLDEPDTNRLARNENATTDTYNNSKNNTDALHTSIVTADGGSFSVPANPYNATYPYNKVLETESGHIIELDDTPGAERVLIGHRAGTYTEINFQGKEIKKTVNDQYNLVGANKNEHVIGSNNITIDANGTLYIKGNYTFKVDGNVNWNVSGDVIWNVTGKYKVQAGPEIDFDAGVINLN